jgi:hypothetical protein
MKKVLLTLFSFLVMLVSKAQVREFLSLGSSTLTKDSLGNFVGAQTLKVRQVKIRFDQEQQKIEFFAKGLLDRDEMKLVNEIFIKDKRISPKMDQHLATEFLGADKEGRKCIVRLKLMSDDFNMKDGELQVEYVDYAVVYSIKKYRHGPIFNGS